MRYDFLRRFEFYFDPATSKISTRLNLMKKGIFAF